MYFPHEVMKEIELINPKQVLEERYHEQWIRLKDALEKTEAEMREYGIPIPVRGESFYGRVSARKNACGPFKTVTEAIVQACQNLPQPFTRQEVIDWVREKCPNRPIHSGTVGSTLARFRKTGELLVVSQGGSGKPGTYKWNFNFASGPGEAGDSGSSPDPDGRDRQG